MIFPFDNAINTLSKTMQDFSDDWMPRREIYCKSCGTSLSSFLDTGFVGCSDCYDAFRSNAIQLAADIHGRVQHVGKVPKSETTKAAKKRELERLIAEKDRAVKSEDYIRADELKSQIARLREELK